MFDIYDYFMKGFHAAHSGADSAQRRIGAELKFPLVREDGSAVSRETIDALWVYLQEHGWKPVVDGMTNTVVGARRPSECNDTIASCETGYCKTEFSLAHVADLHQLERDIDELKTLLRPFAEKQQARFLGYGIHPVAQPGKHLLMKKSRSGVWDRLFGANNHIAPEDGDDVHLFTINAASHTHISVAPEEAVRAVNVLNGFVGAQILLSAHSSIWQGAVDPRYRCVAEKFWDWWMSDSRRIGVPEAPFRDMRHYIDTVTSFKPVFIMRAGKPLLLRSYESFADYVNDPRAVGLDSADTVVPVVPEPADFDLHCTCYWYNARLSRYFTVENRLNDQQPPSELMTVPALTLGLVSALDEAWEELSARDWNELRQSRQAACEKVPHSAQEEQLLHACAASMLRIAQLGLQRRGSGEERFLEPLFERMKSGRCPAQAAELVFEQRGIPGLLDALSL
jgi:gamma-glutamylcysteine synthetase